MRDGIRAFMQAREPERIESQLDTSDELEPTAIGHHWRGNGLIVFRHPERDAAA